MLPQPVVHTSPDVLFSAGGRQRIHRINYAINKALSVLCLATSFLSFLVACFAQTRKLIWSGKHNLNADGVLNLLKPVQYIMYVWYHCSFLFIFTLLLWRNSLCVQAATFESFK